MTDEQKTNLHVLITQLTSESALLKQRLDELEHRVGLFDLRVRKAHERISDLDSRLWHHLTHDHTGC